MHRILGVCRDAFGVDLRALAVLRIGLAAVVLLDLLLRAGDLTAFYTDEGVLPRDALVDGVANTWHMSLHLMNGTSVVQSVLFGIAAAFALAMLAGYRTRLTTIVTWVLLISLHVRNPIVLNGGDKLLRMLIFWCMFLPLGARWSIDARQRARAGLGGTDLPTDRLYCSPATVGLYLQIILMYVTTAILKLGYEPWTSGEAVGIALSKDHLVTDVGRSLRAYPTLLTFLTHGTIWFEILGPLLLLVPFLRARLRLLSILLFWGFHASHGACFAIGIFPIVCIVGFLGFLPPIVLDKLPFGRTARRTRADEEAWREPAPVPTPRTAVMAWRVFGRWLSLAGLGFMLWSVTTSLNENWRMPRGVYNVGAAFKLNQSWRMFVTVREGGGWFSFPGLLKNGGEVDLLTGASPLDFDRPERVSSTFKNARWRKLLMNLKKSKHEVGRKYLGRHLWREWQDDHEGDEQLVRLRVYYIKYDTDAGEDVNPDGGATTVVYGKTYEVAHPLDRKKLYGKKVGEPDAPDQRRVEALGE